MQRNEVNEGYAVIRLGLGPVRGLRWAVLLWRKVLWGLFECLYRFLRAGFIRFIFARWKNIHYRLRGQLRNHLKLPLLFLLSRMFGIVGQKQLTKTLGHLSFIHLPPTLLLQHLIPLNLQHKLNPIQLIIQPQFQFHTTITKRFLILILFPTRDGQFQLFTWSLLWGLFEVRW